MKAVITSTIVSILVCFIISVSDTYSQEECIVCPKTIEEVRKNTRFIQDLDDKRVYYTEGIPKIHCIYFKSGNLLMESFLEDLKGSGYTKFYRENGEFIEPKMIIKDGIWVH